MLGTQALLPEINHGSMVVNPVGNGLARSQVSVRVIRQVDEWDAMHEAWNGLHAACEAAPITLKFDWLRIWWSEYQSAFASAQLFLVTVWRGDRLIGVLPLYLRRNSCLPWAVHHLAFLSTGEAEADEVCADYLDILCAEADKEVVAEKAWRAIAEQAWDHLELLDMPEHTKFRDARFVPGFARLLNRGHCPVADLSSGFEAYIQNSSPSARQQARRLIREGERAEVVFELVAPRNAAVAFEELVLLHQNRWNKKNQPGVFASERFTRFHRALLDQWLPTGQAVLARVSIRGQPIAVIYGFVGNKKFDFYQSGLCIADTGPLRSPGQLAHLLLMRRLASTGIETYDFLRGSSTYKERLSRSANTLIGLEAWRPTTRSVVARSFGLIQRGVRRFFSGLRGASAE